MRFDAVDLGAEIRRGRDMFELRDPAIKLFGRTIPLPETQPAGVEDGEALGLPLSPEHEPEPEPEPVGDEKDACNESTKTEAKDSTAALESLEQGDPRSSSCLNNSNVDNQETFTQDDKTIEDPKPEQDQTEADASGQEKVLKKPDKILPCPRCNSLDTKFCYYNNYNVNQPRHFCKNCQRYWTAGGTMRNVPVGAGRRKNKHSASHYRHIMMSSDGLALPQVDAPDSTHHQTLPGVPSAPINPLKGNGTVLKFGPEAPLCESMAAVLNLQEQKRNTEFSSMACGENRKEPSCASSVTASNCLENGFPDNPIHMEQNSMQGYCNGVTPMHQLQCYPGPPWGYPWNLGWNNVASAAMTAGRCSEVAHGPENGIPSPVPWSGPPIMAASAFCAPNIPFPLMPASFWGWTSGAWNLPWVGTNGGLSPTSSASNSGCSGNGSPTLGKHSRDVSSQVEEKVEKSLWVPKTLRIDDPVEAAKSSIWAALGIKPDERGIFKAFRTKAEKDQTSDSTQVLHANPAALSRSQSFQEST